MDLEKRKYRLIEELLSVKDDSVMDALENILNEETTSYKLEEISEDHKIILDERLQQLKVNSDDLIDWDIAKNEL